MNVSDIIYLTQEQFDTLVLGGSITKDGETFVYDDSAVYCVEELPDDSIKGVKINNSEIAKDSENKVNIEAITTDEINISDSIDSLSTNNEVPTAKAVYDAIQSSTPTITVDPTPTQGSTNPVSSGGVYNSLSNLITRNNAIVYSSSQPTDNWFIWCKPEPSIINLNAYSGMMTMHGTANSDNWFTCCGDGSMTPVEFIQDEGPEPGEYGGKLAHTGYYNEDGQFVVSFTDNSIAWIPNEEVPLLDSATLEFIPALSSNTLDESTYNLLVGIPNQLIFKDNGVYTRTQYMFIFTDEVLIDENIENNKYIYIADETSNKLLPIHVKNENNQYYILEPYSNQWYEIDTSYDTYFRPDQYDWVFERSY